MTLAVLNPAILAASQVPNNSESGRHSSERPVPAGLEPRTEQRCTRRPTSPCEGARWKRGQLIRNTLRNHEEDVPALVRGDNKVDGAAQRARAHHHESHHGSERKAKGGTDVVDQRMEPNTTKTKSTKLPVRRKIFNKIHVLVARNVSTPVATARPLDSDEYDEATQVYRTGTGQASPRRQHQHLKNRDNSSC